jgi:DNA-binding NtrC family response regulator
MAGITQAPCLLFICPLAVICNKWKGIRRRETMAKILALDDVLDAVNLIKRILQRKGHEVVTFTEEEEALNYARSNEVDLAILDIKLKKISGVDVLEELKKIAPATRVIMLTGYPTIETARESLKLGASEYCVKPIDKDELEEKVAEVLKN